MSVLGTSRSQCGHQRFCWMRVWHSAWSWLKLSVAPASVAGNTLIGMLTRLILRYPFQVGLAGIRFLSLTGCWLLVAGCWLLPEFSKRAVCRDALDQRSAPFA